MLDRMRLRENLLDEAGGPLKRFALKRLIGDRDARGIIRLLRERYQTKDVLVQQQKVARAEALAFVAPVHFLSFPAILKGRLDRVWTPGVAYDLTPEAWRGDINGRQQKLTHKKALIIQTTIFDKRGYDAGLRDAMRMVIDDFTLTDGSILAAALWHALYNMTSATAASRGVIAAVTTTCVMVWATVLLIGEARRTTQHSTLLVASSASTRSGSSAVTKSESTAAG